MKRIRVRNISWKDYGISVQTQRELKEFCFLYDEKKKRGEQPGSDRLQNDRRSGKGKQ